MKDGGHGVMLVLLVGLVFGRPALAACGDGILERSEECDPGGATYIDGDPQREACTSGGNCFFRNSCCKFNCQYVGEGATCSDGNTCTRGDQCNQRGVCSGNAIPDGSACDDGQLCTQNEVCEDGICAGEPVPSAFCDDGNVCTFDSCEATANGGAGACVHVVHNSNCNDANDCTLDACDPQANNGAGACLYTPRTGPCDDGQFCTRDDQCNDGVCSGLPYVPPSCIDGNLCTLDQCDANAAGGAGACSYPPDLHACDDGNVCTTDHCNPAANSGRGACEYTSNTSPCDDGRFCTNQDVCVEGICVGTSNGVCDDNDSCTSDFCSEETGCTHVVNVETPECRVCQDGIDNDGDERVDAEDPGCATLALVQDFAVLGTAGGPSEPGAVLRLESSVEIVETGGNPLFPYPIGPSRAGTCAKDTFVAGLVRTGGDVVVIGSSIVFRTLKGAPVIRGALVTDAPTVLTLLGSNPPFVGAPAICGDGFTLCTSDRDCPRRLNCLARRMDDPLNSFVDQTGTALMLQRCVDAQDAVDSIGRKLRSLPAARHIGALRLKYGERQTITVEGGQQVLHFDSIRLGPGARLTLQADDPSTVLVLRVAEGFRVGRYAEIVLAGALSADRVLYSFEGPGSVRLGRAARASGTLFAPKSVVNVGLYATLEGAAIGTRANVRLRAVVRHVPFTPLLR